MFVVGADTIARIADPRYYGQSTAHRDATIAAVAANGCRFLVFGRVDAKEFRTLSDLELPADLRALCDQVPKIEFRCDLSSTELRRRD